MTAVRRTASAKINLFLDVVRRRPDGFHDLESIMQTVNLADELVLEPARETAFRPRFDEPVRFAGFPEDDDNLVMRAVRLVRARAPDAGPVQASLLKRIPMGAGLAGGSADAAAALRAMNELWRLGIPRGEILEMALELGSDVPFCVEGGAALCRGRGEIMEPLEDAPSLTAVLACQSVQVSTARVFQNLDRAAPPAPVAPVLDALRAGDVNALRRLGTNRLEPVALRLYPELRAFREELLDAGMPHALMTGSGSGFFGILSNADNPEEIARRIRTRRADARVWVVRWAPRDPL